MIQVNEGGSNWRVFCANMDVVNPNTKVSTGAVCIDAPDTFPLWFPNSRNILVVIQGQIYVVDTMDEGPQQYTMKSWGPLTRNVFPDPWDYINDAGRTALITKQVSSYVRAEEVYVTISADGKRMQGLVSRPAWRKLSARERLDAAEAIAGKLRERGIEHAELLAYKSRAIEIDFGAVVYVDDADYWASWPDRQRSPRLSVAHSISLSMKIARL